jgi:hypothetical protein
MRLHRLSMDIKEITQDLTNRSPVAQIAHFPVVDAVCLDQESATAPMPVIALAARRATSNVAATAGRRSSGSRRASSSTNAGAYRVS